MPFLTVCLNPTLQKTIVLDELHENGVNRSSEYYIDASGKGINVSRVLTRLGEHTVHLTQAGGIYRNQFISLATSDGITVAPVASHSEIRFCYTLINRRNHTSTEIVEESPPVDPNTESRIRQKYRELLPESHTVIISGSKAAGFSDTLFPDMVREAKEADKTVICDFRGNDLLNVLPFGPDIIKPNFSEFCSTFIPDRSTGEPEDEHGLVALTKKTMVELHEKYGIIPVVTRGEHDILFVENERVECLPAENITPVNTIGCGDAFTAGLASVFRSGGTVAAGITNGRNCATLNALQIRPGYIHEERE